MISAWETTPATLPAYSCEWDTDGDNQEPPLNCAKKRNCVELDGRYNCEGGMCSRSGNWHKSFGFFNNCRCLWAVNATYTNIRPVTDAAVDKGFFKLVTRPDVLIGSSPGSAKGDVLASGPGARMLWSCQGKDSSSQTAGNSFFSLHSDLSKHISSSLLRHS